MHHPDIRRTLVFLLKDDAILLAMKKRGFGSNRYNGVGGKLKSDETIEQALIRETQEEIEVTPLSYEKVAELDFICDVETADQWRLYLHVYICREWQGEPQETEEMAPEWFALDDIPYENMWSDDQYWLPLILAGDKVKATFQMSQDEQVLSHQLQTVKEF